MAAADPERGDAASSAPDVAVVIIAYNDVHRLPNAIESALDQTLNNLEIVIVDDASTDGTGELADEWAARSPKIRSVHLPVNSGGCSRPRNVGLEHVRARHVMFLDSDDLLERHACKNLLLAVERSGADFAAGRCVRVAIDRKRRQSSWCGRLYEQPRVVEGIYEMPELLDDTLCTNKLYSVSFLDKHAIRFPEGVHYEDLAFTAEAYCAATRIAVIPEAVYYWQTYNSDSHRKSISSHRADPRNFRDRLAVYRMINAFLDREGHSEIRSLTDSRFLRNDLKMYLGELAERDAEYQLEWMRLATEYLREMDLSHIMSERRICRLAGYLVRQGDLELALKAAALWRFSRLSVPLVRKDERLYFADAYLDDPAGREATDVTWLGLRDARFPDLQQHCELAKVVRCGRNLTLTGTVVNQLGRLPMARDLTACLELRTNAGGKPAVVELPITNLDVTGEQLAFTTTLKPGMLPRRPVRAPEWSVRLRLAHGRDTVTMSVVALDALRSWSSGDRPGTRTREKLTPRLADGWLLKLCDNRPARATMLRAQAQRRVSASRPWRLANAALTGRRMKAAAYRHVLRRLPLRPDTVLFECHLGKQYGDSPRYVYEQMVAEGLPVRAVWSYAHSADEYPDKAVRVRRDTWRYYFEAARAACIVDNQGMPSPVVRRSGQRYVQTWHGTPFKLMGYDLPEIAWDARKADQLRAGVARWDAFAVQSEWAAQVFGKAFGLSCPILRTGYPRNDALHGATDPERIAELRHRLRIPDGRKILLYAPTFRRYPAPLVLADPDNAPQLDLDRFAEALGDEWFVLLRAHYLDRAAAMSVRTRHAPVARNVSGYHDITELLMLADALLTDYSSVMFDYAITGRPMGFYAPDYAVYRQLRGGYFDLPAEAPGPVLHSTAEIVEWLGDLDAIHQRHADRYRDFRARYCEYESGTAAAQIVRALFGPLDQAG
jgi:CDP-glycerol glycerophosphotransferase